MSQIPEKCHFCQSDRVGIQEGVAYFKCGTQFLYTVTPVRAKQSGICAAQTRPDEYAKKPEPAA